MDLTVLFRNIEDKIEVDENVSFQQEELEQTEIERLEDVEVKGSIFKNSMQEIECDLTVSGTMILKDAISSLDVSYSFSFPLKENLEDFIEKDKNTLAFKEFLWENIVLEVPIRYTTVEDYSNYQGDGWRLTSEEDVSLGNNPFQELLNNQEKE